MRSNTKEGITEKQTITLMWARTKSLYMAEQDGVGQAHFTIMEWNGRGQYKLKGVPREEKKLRENLPINTNKNIHKGQTQSQHQAPLSHEHAKHTALNQYEPIIMNMSNTQHAVKQKALIKTQP